MIYISLSIDCLFESKKLQHIFLWLSLQSLYRVTDEAFLLETSKYVSSAFVRMCSLFLKEHTFVISHLGFKSGYWQVELREESKDKAVLQTGLLGIYECDSMPFGFCNVPASFQGLMEKCRVDLNLQNRLIYLDITVSSLFYFLFFSDRS